MNEIDAHFLKGVELFNRGAASVNLSGWSVQYASASGSSWQATPLTAVVLAPGVRSR